MSLSSPTLQRPFVIVPAALFLIIAAVAMLWLSATPHPAPDAAAPRAPASLAPMLVTAAPIARGQVMSAGDVTLRPTDAAHTPVMALHRVADAEGHIALKDIAAGAPLLTDALSPSTVLGLAAHVPQGFRAYAVPVSEVEIAGGLLQAGDRVDLYVTLPGALFGREAKSDDESKATLLQENVTVLAVGTKLSNDGSANAQVRTVTLALNEDVLAKVALAARLGTVSFAIRNPLDREPAKPALAALAALVGETPATPKPLAVKTPRPHAVAGIPFYAGREMRTAPLSGSNDQ